VKLQHYPRNTQCIYPKGIYYAAPVVKIIAFLDLEHISADFEIEHFETASIFRKNQPDNSRVVKIKSD